MSTKKEFLNEEFWVLTFGAAFQRVRIYSVIADNKRDRDILKLGIRTKIEDLVEEKYSGIMVDGSKDHMNNIVELKAWIDEVFPTYLYNFEITIGVVQKLLNMYLKYSWTSGWIPEPPHCPFDRNIIKLLKLKKSPAWTKINTIEEYETLVEAAQEVACLKSLAHWELEVFERN